MKIFVTGASGWIGTPTVRRLIAAGHEVLGLARSEESAAAVRALGAQVHRGGLDDPSSLAAGAAASDGVVHLAYHHDFSEMDRAAAWDREAVDALAEALSPGSPLLVASGLLGLRSDGGVGTEDDRPDPSVHPRVATGQRVVDLGASGVRSAVVRLAPTVHGQGDGGFVRTLAQVARERGVSAYVGDGANRWPAVHVDDAAALLALGVESAEAGSVLHAVAEEGVATRDIATALGEAMGLPVESIDPAAAGEHFGWIGMFFAADAPASSALTQQRLSWTPTGPTLLQDIAAGHYTVSE